MTNPLILIENICKTYKNGPSETRALNNVSLRINKGEYLSIMGKSGSGKSTLLHILGLLDSSDSGSYQFKGKAVSHLNDQQQTALRLKTFGFVFQQFHLLHQCSIYDNIALPMLYHRYPKKEIDNRISKLLNLVALTEKINSKPSQLSGGQKQRIALARALANRPEVIFADEPTGALDCKTTAQILLLLKQLHKEGLTIIIITHDLEVAKSTNRIITISDGMIESDSSYHDN